MNNGPGSVSPLWDEPSNWWRAHPTRGIHIPLEEFLEDANDAPCACDMCVGCKWPALESVPDGDTFRACRKWLTERPVPAAEFDAPVYTYVSARGERWDNASLHETIVGQLLEIEELQRAFDGLECASDQLGTDGYNKLVDLLGEIEEEQINALCELVGALR